MFWSAAFITPVKPFGCGVKLPSMVSSFEVTLVPPCAVIAHAPGQSMPPGDEVTRPAPLPIRFTLTTKLCGGGGGGGAADSKSTQTSPVDVIVHAPAPWQPPPQPANVEPVAACAVSMTGVPFCAVIEQVPGQSIPAGDEVTRPLPLPTLLTVTRKLPVGGGGWFAPNSAVTVWSALMVTEQLPVPEQSPCQPAKVLPASAVAAS